MKGFNGGVLDAALDSAVVHGGARVPDEVALGDGNDYDLAVELLTGLHKVLDAGFLYEFGGKPIVFPKVFQFPLGLQVAGDETEAGSFLGHFELLGVLSDEALVFEAVLAAHFEDVVADGGIDHVCARVCVFHEEPLVLAVGVDELAGHLEAIEQLVVGVHGWCCWKRAAGWELFRIEIFNLAERNEFNNVCKGLFPWDGAKVGSQGSTHFGLGVV